MGLFTNIGGQSKELSSLTTNAGGQLKELKSLYTNVGGELKELYTQLPTNVNLHWGGFSGNSCSLKIGSNYNNFEKEYSTFLIGKFKVNNTSYVNFTCNQDDEVTNKYKRTNAIQAFLKANPSLLTFSSSASYVYFMSYYIVELKTEKSVNATPYMSWEIRRSIKYMTSKDAEEVQFKSTEFQTTGSTITSDVKALDANEYYVYATRCCLMLTSSNGVPIDFTGMEMDINFNFQQST